MTGFPGQNQKLRAMVAAAADEVFGVGVHQIGKYEALELSGRINNTAAVQTIISKAASTTQLVEIYILSENERDWNLLARAEISPGEQKEMAVSTIRESKEPAFREESLSRESILNIEPDERQTLIENHLQSQVAGVLGLDTARLQVDQPLDRLGLDSLMAIDLKNKLEKTLDVVVPIVSFLEGPSITDLSRQVIDQLTAPELDPGIKITAVTDPSEDQPLSYNQQSLWFLRQLTPEETSFNVSGAVKVHGKLNLAHLEIALEKLQARHASLRTTFPMVEGQPVQRIHEGFPVPLQVIDCAGWTKSQHREYLNEAAHKPFDLAESPAIRVILFHENEIAYAQQGKQALVDGAVLLLAMDHIVSDFWSISVLVQEALSLYEGLSSGLSVPLEPLRVQYADYVHWQREMLSSEVGDRLLAYWKNELPASLPLLDLPMDRPRPALQTFRGDSKSLVLSEAVTAGVKDLSRAHNVTLYMTLLAAFQVFLHRFSGQDAFMVGSVTAGRSQPDLNRLIGYFINPLTLRADLSENPSFSETLSRVRKIVLGAIEHQDYPPALLAENMPFRRDPSRPPLFETMFILQKAQLSELSALSPFALGIGDAQLAVGDLVLESLTIADQPAQFDLTLMMAEMGDRLAASLHYNTDLFDAKTISRMLRYFETLIAGLLANPEKPIRSIPLLTSEERNKILVAWNSTELDLPSEASACRMFETQAARSPDATAVIFETERLSYRSLNEKANQLAHYLKSLGVGPEQLVGIYLDRSPDMMVALLGVHKAGGAYVPLDPEYPEERLAMMLADSQPRVLLTQDALKETLPNQEFRVVSLDGDWESIAANNVGDPITEFNPEHLAYVIYTSGSTGIPKGVQITHRAMVNFLNSMRVEPGLTSEDLLLAVTTLSFDIAVLELFLPLVVGAAVEVVSREVASDGARLVEKLTSSAATMMQATPATWRMMVEAGWEIEPSSVDRGQGHNGAGLTVLCGGEALSGDLAEKLLARAGKVWNMYGPTETTVWSTICEVETGGGTLPIGRPIGNTQVYVLDPDMQPVPVGVVGELYIGGEGVARGYRNRPELTAEKFVEDPFRGDENARLYKTGDLVRLLPDGRLMFLGRIDNQVKVRGFRIELGEIEAALIKHPAVQETVVTAHEDAPGEVRLIAYSVLAKQVEEPSVNDMRGFLRRWLPDYMLPATYITLDEFPLTPNGKLDRRALPAPTMVRPKLAQAYVDPRNEQEAQIAAICAQILGLERVGVHDDFFELGGNSLMATRLIYQLQEQFETRMPLIRLFEAPTIAGLSNALDAARLESGDSPGLFGSITLEELEAEVSPVEDLGVNGLVYDHKKVPDKILLTGATGFVGAFLLSDLLAEIEADVICLVRARNPEVGMQRIRKNLEKYQLWDADLETRIYPVVGDIGQPQLGLGESAYRSLASELDVIYHNGALVNFVFPYDAHKQVNVDGTLEILKLASDTRIKPVHFVSSLAVFLSGNSR